MSSSSRSLHDIAATGDAKALSAMLIGEVDVNMADRVSMDLCFRRISLCSHLLHGSAGWTVLPAMYCASYHAVLDCCFVI